MAGAIFILLTRKQRLVSNKFWQPSMWILGSQHRVLYFTGKTVFHVTHPGNTQVTLPGNKKRNKTKTCLQNLWKEILIVSIILLKTWVTHWFWKPMNIWIALISLTLCYWLSAAKGWRLFEGWCVYKNALIPRNKASRLKQNSGGFWFLMIWKGITVFSECWVQCFFWEKRYFSGIMVQRLIYRSVCFKIFCGQVFQCSSVIRRDGPVNEKDSKLKH